MTKQSGTKNKVLHPEALLMHCKRAVRTAMIPGNENLLPPYFIDLVNAGKTTEVSAILSNHSSDFYKDISIINCIRKNPWDFETLFSLACESLKGTMQTFCVAFDALFFDLSEKCRAIYDGATDPTVQFAFAHYTKLFISIIDSPPSSKYEFWVGEKLPVTEAYFLHVIKDAYLQCWTNKQQLRGIVEYLTLYRPSIFREIFGTAFEEEKEAKIVMFAEMITSIPAVFLRECYDTGYKQSIIDGTLTDDMLYQFIKRDIEDIIGIDIDSIMSDDFDINDASAIGGKIRNIIEQFKKSNGSVMIKTLIDKVSRKEPSHGLKFLVTEEAMGAINRFTSEANIKKMIREQIVKNMPQLIEAVHNFDPRLGSILNEVLGAMDQKPIVKFKSA